MGPNHHDTIVSRNNLALAYKDDGQPARAIPLFEQTIKGLTKVLGPDHTDTLACRGDLGMAYLAAGEPAKAEPLLREYLQWVRKQFGEADPRTAGAMDQLGMDLIQQGKWVEAEPLFRGCLAIREPIQPDDWTTFNTRSMLGGSLLGQNRYADAEPLILAGYEGMKAREARIPASARPRLAQTAQQVVRLYEAWGKTEQAKAWKEKLAFP